MFCFFLSVIRANAAVTVNDQILQQGLFRDPDCKSGEMTITPPECLCKADMHYPNIKGMKNKSAQEIFNQSFKILAEQNRYYKCYGKITNLLNKDRHSWINQNYEATFHSDTILAILHKLSQFDTTAAHPNQFISGTIVDTRTGKLLTAKDIFGKNIPQVNHIIYDKLPLIECSDPVSIKELKGKFLDDENSTLLLVPEGIIVAFGVNRVACSAAGIPKVLIDKEFITYKEIYQNMR